MKGKKFAALASITDNIMGKTAGDICLSTVDIAAILGSKQENRIRAVGTGNP